jgi:adenylate cyclase
VVQHLINHAFGIVSIEAAEAYRETIGAVFQSLPGLVLLYGSLLIHATIALRSIYRRSSLRLSLWQWLQLLLGLSILPLVVGHAVANRGFDLLGNIDPNYYYVVTSILLKPVFLVKLIFLIAIIWIHMAIGLHYWLRIRKTYPRILPYAYTLVVLIPALAYVGLFSMLQQASGWLEDEQRLDRIYAANIAMDSSDVEFLRGLETQAWIVMAALLLLTLVARQIRLKSGL